MVDYLHRDDVDLRRLQYTRNTPVIDTDTAAPVLHDVGQLYSLSLCGSLE